MFKMIRIGDMWLNPRTIKEVYIVERKHGFAIEILGDSRWHTYKEKIESIEEAELTCYALISQIEEACK